MDKIRNSVRFSLVFFITVFAGNTFGKETAEACVKYETQQGWSKGYAVNATLISGSDLNEAVGSLTTYKNFSDYAVVFWDKDQVSIYELPPLTSGDLPIFEQVVKDQTGRRWKIKDGHLFCN